MVPSIQPVQNHEHANRIPTAHQAIEITASMMSIWSLRMPWMTTRNRPGRGRRVWWQPARNAGPSSIASVR